MQSIRSSPSASRPISISTRRSDSVERALYGLALAAACAACGASQAKIAAHGRGPARAAWARHLAIYLQHVVFGASISACARVFRRDRASVRHACARVEDARDDPRFDAVLAHLESALRAQSHMVSTFIVTFMFKFDGGSND
jgi:hypothetical protein